MNLRNFEANSNSSMPQTKQKQTLPDANNKAPIQEVRRSKSLSKDDEDIVVVNIEETNQNKVNYSVIPEALDIDETKSAIE